MLGSACSLTGAPPPPNPRALATLAFHFAPSPPTPCRSLREESFGVRSPFCHAGWASNSYLAARPCCLAARSRSACPDPPYGRNGAGRARPLRVPQRSRSGRAGLGLLIDGGSPAPETPARRAVPHLRWRHFRVGHPAPWFGNPSPLVRAVAVLALCAVLRFTRARPPWLSLRSVPSLPLLDRRYWVKPFRATARFITSAAACSRPLGAWGLGDGRQPPLAALRPLRVRCVAQARHTPAPAMRQCYARRNSRPAGARASFVGTTRATSSALDYFRAPLTF